MKTVAEVGVTRRSMRICAPFEINRDELAWETGDSAAQLYLPASMWHRDWVFSDSRRRGD